MDFSVFDKMQNPVVVVSNDFIILFVNRSFELKFLLSSSDQNRHLNEIFTESLNQKAYQFCNQVIRDQSSGHAEWHFSGQVATSQVYTMDGGFVIIFSPLRCDEAKPMGSDYGKGIRMMSKEGEADLFYETAIRMNRSLSLKGIYDELHDAISKLMDCDGFFVSEYDSSTKELSCRYARQEGLAIDETVFPRIPLDASGGGTQSIAVRTGQSQLINDYQQRRQKVKVHYYYDPKHDQGLISEDVPRDKPTTQSAVIVPIKLGKIVIGVLQVFSYRLNGYTNEDLHKVEALTAFAAGVTRNALLFETIRKEIRRRHQIQMDLADSRERLQSIVETLPCLLVICDRNGNIIYQSPNCEHFAGPQKRCAHGEIVWWIHPDDKERVRAVFLDALAKEKEHLGFEYKAVNRNGQSWYASSSWKALWGPENTFNGFVIQTNDVSQHHKLEAALRRRNLELDVLLQSTQSMATSLHLEDVMQMILERVRHMLSAAVCSVWLVSEETSEIVCHQVTGPQEDLVKGWRLQPGEGLVGWVIQNCENLYVKDVTLDDRHYTLIDNQTGFNVRSIVTVCIQTKDRPIGAIQVLDSRVDAFDKRAINLLESLAATAAITIENARLYRQAIWDAETKTILLQEMNHRVKNNISGIIGMLYTALRYLSPEEKVICERVIGDIVNRLQSLAAVHSLLSDMKWQPVLLSDLTMQIFKSTKQILQANNDVFVSINPSEIRVTAEQARNVSLVINEIVINTLKHGTKLNGKTKIDVNIRREDRKVIFRFQDNGPGFSESVLNGFSDHQGFTLIKQIIKRSMKGTVDFKNDDGAVIEIKFPECAKRSVLDESWNTSFLGGR